MLYIYIYICIIHIYIHGDEFPHRINGPPVGFGQRPEAKVDSTEPSTWRGSDWEYPWRRSVDKMRFILSMDWFKGKFTGKPHIY